MDDYYYSDTGAEALVGTIFLGIILFSLLLAAAMYVVMAFALMRFFRKVGVESWIAWVPIYNTWKWLEVGGMKGWWALIALIPYGSIVSSIFLYIGMYRTGIAFRKGAGFLVLGIFFPFVWAFILGSRDAVYEPQLITQAGFPPPRAGYGSIPPGAPYVAPGYAQGGYAPYPGPPATGAPAGYGAPQYAPPAGYGSAPAYTAPPTDNGYAPVPPAAAPGYTDPAAGYAAPPAYAAPSADTAPQEYAAPPAYAASPVYDPSAPVAPPVYDAAPPAYAAPVPPAEQAPPVAPAPATNIVPPMPPIRRFRLPTKRGVHSHAV